MPPSSDSKLITVKQVLPASYGLGLFFLPKQYRQEYSRVRAQDDDDTDEGHRFSLEETQYRKPVQTN